MNERYNSFSSQGMIKLVYGNKNKIIKHGSKGFLQLRKVIASNFPEAPTDYSLSYLDQDQDEICLNSEQDLANMLNYNLKVYKVYIKQSLSQTVVLDLERSDIIEPSFEQTESRIINTEEIKQEMKFDKPKEEDQKVYEDVARKSEKVLFNSIESYGKQPELQLPKEESQNQIIVTAQKSQSADHEKTVDPLPQKERDIRSEYIEVESEEILVPKHQIKVTFDAAIQSQSVDIQVPKVSKVEPIRMEIDPTKMLFSNSLDVSSIRKIPTVFEQRMDVTRARIVSKTEEVRVAPKKQIEIELHEVICTSCKDEFGIIGTRYQCILCEGFNLCSNCQVEAEHEHSLVKVKRPGQAIRRDQLIEKLRGQIYPKHPKIPQGYYVPSLNKEDAQRIIEAAREAYKLGMERSQKLMEDVFFKLQMSHKNPYEIARPAPEKVETIYDKAKYLQDLMGVSYHEAQKFVALHPHANSQKIVQIYLATKSL